MAAAPIGVSHEGIAGSAVGVLAVIARSIRTRAVGALLAGLLGLAAPAFADGEALKARHAGLTEQLARSQFQRPLVLESTQTSGDLKGEIYAVMEDRKSVV